jgi:hypothetical protein
MLFSLLVFDFRSQKKATILVAFFCLRYLLPPFIFVFSRYLNMRTHIYHSVFCLFVFILRIMVRKL